MRTIAQWRETPWGSSTASQISSVLTWVALHCHLMSCLHVFSVPMTPNTWAPHNFEWFVFSSSLLDECAILSLLQMRCDRDKPYLSKGTLYHWWPALSYSSRVIMFFDSTRIKAFHSPDRQHDSLTQSLLYTNACPGWLVFSSFPQRSGFFPVSWEFFPLHLPTQAFSAFSTNLRTLFVPVTKIRSIPPT